MPSKPDQRLPPRLPMDVRPRQGETVSNYLERLAAANHLKTSVLRGYLQGAMDSRWRPRLDRLAAVSGRSQEVLRRTLAGFLCERCSAPLQLGKPGPARWCSASCRTMAYLERHPERAPVSGKPSITVSCDECGGTVPPDRASPWCSRECRRTARDRRGRCQRCSRLVTYRGRGPRPRWCSDSCRSMSSRDRRRQRTA